MTVSWELTIETLTTNNLYASPFVLQPPFVIGTLSISDDIFFSGNLNYSYKSNPACFECITQIGTLDGWSMALGSRYLIFPEPSPNLNPDLQGNVSLTFDSSGDISGTIFQSTPDVTLRMTIDNNSALGSAAADYTIFGCSFDARCDYTGSWSLAPGDPVPLTASISEPNIILPFILASLFLLRRKPK